MSPPSARRLRPQTGMLTPAFQASFLSGISASPSSKRQASRNPGEPTDKPPTTPTWKSCRSGNKSRSRTLSDVPRAHLARMEFPILRVPCIQANANVVVVEPSKDSTFDYWLRISTLDKGHPLRIPVKLASSHRKALDGRTLNTSTTLHKRDGVWWLILSFDKDVPLQTALSAPCFGVDVGITNFITTSTGKQYSPFHGKLARRPEARSAKAPREGQATGLLEREGGGESPLDQQRYRTKPEPPCAAGDQPGGQSPA